MAIKRYYNNGYSQLRSQAIQSRKLMANMQPMFSATIRQETYPQVKLDSSYHFGRLWWILGNLLPTVFGLLIWKSEELFIYPLYGKSESIQLTNIVIGSLREDYSRMEGKNSYNSNSLGDFDWFQQSKPNILPTNRHSVKEERQKNEALDEMTSSLSYWVSSPDFILRTEYFLSKSFSK